MHALGAQHEELRKNDERIYKRFYPDTTSLAATTVAELQGALKQGYDIVHLLCDVDAQGTIADGAGARISGAELLEACVDSGAKLFWIASDNFADPYNAGFQAKGHEAECHPDRAASGPELQFVSG